MPAPNIDIIAASLRNCSLSGGAASSPPPFHPIISHPAAVADATDTPLELNSDLALPYHWEQCLDLKTGKIYYINWSTGAKTMEDPRKCCYSEEEDDDDDADDADDENDGVEDDEDDDSSQDSITDSDEQGNCSSAFSSSSSSSSRDTIERGGGGTGGSVLVAAGCRVCMMYVMIPKREEECPRCGGHVLHFGRSRETEIKLERE